MTKGKFTELELQTLGTDLFKYQKFSTKALKKYVPIPSWLNDATYLKYVSGMRQFLKDGTTATNYAPVMLYDVLQKCLDKHTAVLTPSMDDKYIPGQYGRKTGSKPLNSKVKVTKMEESKVNNSTKIELSENTQQILKVQRETVKTVGLMLDNIIKILPDESYLRGYMDAYKEQNEDMKFCIVDITYHVRENE